MLCERRLEPEEMDDPALPAELLQGALVGLARLNLLSNSAQIVWRPIRRLAKELATDRLRVLDIATGSGDVPRALMRRARRAGLKLDICGIDFSPRSVGLARRLANEAGLSIQFECKNALADDLPREFDLVMCSLFLHHLTADDAVRLLTKMAAAARRVVLVSDLRRCYWGLGLAFSASRLVTRCRIVHEDAVRSVRAAFTAKELLEMAEAAGLDGAAISNQWPARMLLSWTIGH
jgi:2-polyprenyl-3-methyl-5-hydroxy-6-metoxy-1,4-benzoquinol methylase